MTNSKRLKTKDDLFKNTKNLFNIKSLKKTVLIHINKSFLFFPYVQLHVYKTFKNMDQIY